MQYGKNAHRNNKSRWGRSQAMIGSSHPLYPPQEQMFVLFINIHLKRISIFSKGDFFEYSSAEYYTFWTTTRVNNDASYSLVGRKSLEGKMELLQNSVLAHSLCCPWWFLQDWKNVEMWVRKRPTLGSLSLPLSSTSFWWNMCHGLRDKIGLKAKNGVFGPWSICYFSVRKC